MYSQMLSKLKLSTPQAEIGEVVTVLAGNNANESLANTQGKFLLTNRVYNQADYPELYSKIGLVGASAWVPTPAVPTPLNQPDIYYGVTYGIGLYVLAGGTSISMVSSSTNLTNWSPYTHLGVGNLYTITYGNGIFVIASDGSWVGTSTNGTSWTGRIGNDYLGRANVSLYANGRYLVGGNLYTGGGRLRTSTDAINWTTVTLAAAPAAPGGLTYGLGNYYYCSGSNIYTSTDSITWTTGTSGTSSNITAIGYGNGLFVYAGSNSMIATSTNASNWTQRNFGVSGATPKTIFYANGRFFVGCEAGILRTSTDGINWSGVGVSNTTPWVYSMTYGNGKYVYVNGGGATTGGISQQAPLVAYSDTGYLPQNSPLYNVSTQFYVPSFTEGSRYYTLPSTYGANSNVRYTSYIRAK